jgi:hypothetical protein
VEGLSLRSYGVRIGIRLSQPGALETVAARLPPGWTPASSPVVDRLYSLIVGGSAPGEKLRRLNLVYSGAARLARDRKLDPVLDALEIDIRHEVAAVAPRRVFIHAGVVGWGGRAIVIPGRTFTGKSTLVAALVRAGATYYSDEYAVLDEKGRVHPFAKPLSIREDGGYTAAETPVAALGGKSGARPLPVGVIAIAPYKADARWRPRKRSRGDGALGLLANAVPARREPARTLSAIRRAVADAVILKGSRGEADEMAEALLARAEGP